MNIILISECTKTAAKYSRRILSKYARNIARRTWIASITKQGLEHLQQELSQIATKNTAVACHKITSRTEIQLAWIVGSHKEFDSEGNFAFRYTENLSARYQIDLTQPSHEAIKFFSLLNKLAGLFHDVGKNFYYFQEKLIKAKKGKASGDPIRHEYISFLCFFYLFDEEKDDYIDQLIYIKKNIDQLDFDQLQKFLNNKKCKNLFKKIINKSSENLFLLKAITHLILSHHRLINGSVNNKSIQLHDISYFNKIFNELSDSEKNKIFQCYQQQNFIFFNQKWKNQLNSIIEKLTELLADKNAFLIELINNENLFLSISHYILRPALIMADQRVSARLSKVKEAIRIHKNYPQRTAIANFQQEQINQSLREHLIWVGGQSFKNNTVLWQSIFSRKRLYTVEASAKMLRPVAKSLEQFQWQNAAVNAIKKIDKSQSFGFFAVVMAKTGAGKTRANAKIMAALNPEMRFSTLLGLRTLTLQTLDEYRENLGIKKQHIMGIIGDKNTHVLDKFTKEEQTKKQAKEQAEDKEISTLNALFEEEKNIELSDFLFKDVDTPFPEELCFSNQRDTKLDTISKIPILVATIDYIIQGIDARRSSKTRFLTRLMTSDIIIDEIDSYNQNDLIAIHKLVYLVGFYGKKLIISSATLPELLIKSFYLAYSTGYQRFKSYADKKNASLYIGLFTHIDALNQVTKEKNIETIIPPFIDQFYHAIQQEKVKRRANVLDISDYLHSDLNASDTLSKELALLYKKIMISAQQLHLNNHTVINGVSISTGLIKFNNTVDAFHFSHYLFNDPDLEQQAIIKIECYHARHFPIRRNYTEQVLAKLLNRKKDNTFQQQDIVKNALQQAHQQGKKQIILLVVSTTIIEIGRDFDFDWGIIEPRSHWSIIQTVGRILRHRNIERHDNVVLLSHSMKAVRDTGNEKHYYSKNEKYYYNKPGPEITKEGYYLATEDKNKSVKELFEYQALSKKIDASITLKNTQGKPIKNLENKQIQTLLENKDQGGFLSYLNNPLEYISTFNSDQNPFRGKYQPHCIYRQDEHYQWYHFDIKTKKLLSNHTFKEIELTFPARSLIDKTLEEIEIEYAKKGIELKQEIITHTKPENSKKYNEFLGVL